MSFIVENNRHERGQILQNVNGQYFYVCAACKFEFVTISTFLTHLKDEHDAKTPPNLLDNSTEPQPQIAKQTKSSQETQIRKTPIASTAHKRMKPHDFTGEGSGEYKCKNCGSMFRSLINLGSHQIVCQILPLHQCEYCGDFFKNNSMLQLHLKIHQTQFSCDICKEGFDLHWKLVKHRRLHRYAISQD